MTTNRINHTGHNHPNTPAARAACRKNVSVATPPVAAARNGEHVVNTPEGFIIRVGSLLWVRFVGDQLDTLVRVTAMHRDIKNGYPGIDCVHVDDNKKRWCYTDQIFSVDTF